MTLHEGGLDVEAGLRGRWFAPWGWAAVSAAGQYSVYIGGQLVAVFGERDRLARNVALVHLGAAHDVHLGKLAAALDLTDETVRVARREYERDPAAAIAAWARPLGGRERVLTGAGLRRAERLFAKGRTLDQVHRALVKSGLRVSRTTIAMERMAWRARTQPATATAAPPATELEAAASDLQQTMSLIDAAPPPPPADGEEELVDGGDRGDDGDQLVVDAPVRGGRGVQHAGSWLLLAMLAKGLHEACEAERVRAERDRAPMRASTLRTALDAFVIALAVGEKCVEGVRRIATPTAPLLLRASRAPSANWVRRVLDALAQDGGGTQVMLRIAGAAMRAARAATAGHPVVFYADNHLRTYTGEQVVRKGWRMQDRRVVPGITDCYVHDEDGRAVLRIDAPEHDPLTSLLGRVTTLLRAGLGDEERILVAFDRAGAFPEQLASLRDDRVDFVTYERRPYPLLAQTAFDHTLQLGDETVQWVEERAKNLGGGRGRVRRISVLDEGRQINLVAAGTEPAEWLIGVMRGRWKQENAFKHAIERWGQDQLDARGVEHYAPETIVPNPARRRLDHALRLARVREGDARRELARLPEGDRRCERHERDLEESMEQQSDLESQRPRVPEHAELANTELAGKLVYHDASRKLLLDAVRIASANVESELAAMLAPHTTRPREAKKVIANLFAATGDVETSRTRITVRLAVAANTAERLALAALLDELADNDLTLPGDRRRIRFQLQD